MAAVVRVKRRIDENPVDSLVVSCKRLKKISDEENLPEANSFDKEIKGLFKFAVTVSQQEGSIVKHIKDAIRKEKRQREYKLHGLSPDRTFKARRHHRLTSQQQRYQVVAHKRALEFEGLDLNEAQNGHEEERNISSLGKETRIHPRVIDECASACRQTDTDEEERKNKRLFCLYDVEINGKSPKEPDGACGNQEVTNEYSPLERNTITCNSVPMIRERIQQKMPDYVYDLYYLNSSDFDFRALENILAIEANADSSIYMPNEANEDCEVYDDEDDSNDENNWRNDYPDEDPCFYENDDDYTYGEESYHYTPTFDDDDEAVLQNMMARNLQLDDRYSSTEDDEDNDDTWRPSNNYSDYMAKVMKDLGQSHEDDD